MKHIGTPEQLAALFAARAKARAEYLPLKKNAHVKYHSKKLNSNVEFDYADKDEICRCTVAANTKHGIDVRQHAEVIVDANGRKFGVLTTVVSHQEGGAEISEMMFDPADDIKDFGGQITYLSRYALNPILFLGGSEDADDNEVHGSYQGKTDINKPKKAETPRKVEKPAPLKGVNGVDGHGNPVRSMPFPEEPIPVGAEPAERTFKSPGYVPPEEVPAEKPAEFVKYTREQADQINELVAILKEEARWTRGTVMATLTQQCKIKGLDELSTELATTFIAYLEKKVKENRAEQEKLNEGIA